MENKFKTIIEPFRIKVTEAIKMTTEAERVKILAAAGLNPFLIKSEDVILDLLTDSGTTAMSQEQWAALMRGDESYAGSPSYYRFEESLQKLTGHPEIIPTHQGRASERIVFASLCKPNDLIISNTLFDTTRANAQSLGAKVIDIPCSESRDTMKPSDFKGNIDLEALQEHLKGSQKIAMVVMTITNNSGGGQPASLKNLKECAALCRQYKIPFMIDACRFAENAWFIKLREEGQKTRSTFEIAREVFELADIITVSAKKDGMTNIGGFITLKNKEWATLCRNNLILTEGFPTYGGLAGRDLEAIAVGVWEALDEEYLRYRVRSVSYVGDAFLEMGIPIVNPPGGHAIYIDAAKYLPHIKPLEFPGQALAASIYRFAGVRCCEIGSVMFGQELPDGTEKPHTQELVRLAIPRRAYTQSHMDYLVEAFEIFTKDEAPKLRGVRFKTKPKVLRHFTATFEWV